MRRSLLCCASLCLCGSVAFSAGLDEFKVKREPVFEFARRPEITRRGDRIEIRFETKGFRDVTVAIEEAGSPEKGVGDPTVTVPAPFFRARIVRHLASGVLGANAPEPFQKNSRAQTIVWDGKNDQGEYIDDKDRLAVRVSLGLDPRYEKTLYWSPHKRISQAAPLIQANDEGVFVFEGAGVDSLRMDDHEGRYLSHVGNARILSLTLGYHTEARVALRDVADQG